MEKFVAVRDTQEKKGWFFEEDKDCAGTSLISLKTGDYTILGLENLLCIERKRTTGEIATNVCEERFSKELDRMANYKYRFIVMEFDIRDVYSFPANSRIPTDKWSNLKVTSNFLAKKLTEYQLAGISCIFAGQFGKKITLEIMKQVWRKHHKEVL